MTDRDLIKALIEKRLDELKGWEGSATEKRDLAMRSISRAINCSIRTLANAKYSESQILGADKSKLLRIHAKEKGVIK